ncbi:MAG TPA: hypothetical protein VLR54_03375, partial [Methanobacteriaceae archaeon]|nr:hypothetical protein [Methanobacteriaceae archaeon]
MYDLIPTIYLVTSIISIILAITAILFSLSVERRLKENFLRLKDLIEFQHQRTEELMNNINQESVNIQSVVYETQAEIHEALQDMQKHC